MTDAENRTRWNLTTLSDEEWAERLALSFERAATTAPPKIAEWYRQEAIKVRMENLKSESVLRS